jgi:hypothetical protein
VDLWGKIPMSMQAANQALDAVPMTISVCELNSHTGLRMLDTHRPR